MCVCVRVLFSFCFFCTQTKLCGKSRSVTFEWWLLLLCDCRVCTQLQRHAHIHTWLHWDTYRWDALPVERKCSSQERRQCQSAPMFNLSDWLHILRGGTACPLQHFNSASVLFFTRAPLSSWIEQIVPDRKSGTEKVRESGQFSR